VVLAEIRCWMSMRMVLRQYPLSQKYSSCAVRDLSSPPRVVVVVVVGAVVLISLESLEATYVPCRLATPIASSQNCEEEEVNCWLASVLGAPLPSPPILCVL